jgi:hypothetical protein
MKYEEMQPITHEELSAALRGSKASEAARAILRMALHESDFAWAESECLAALHDSRPEVKAAAITALGHLARIHHALIHPTVVAELRSLQNDPRFAGIAEDALDDVSTFASSPARTN